MNYLELGPIGAWIGASWSRHLSFLGKRKILRCPLFLKKNAIHLFSNLRITELVDLYHSSEGNQTDEGVLGYHRQRHDKVVLETLELVLVHASIDDKQKDGAGNRPLLRKRVFDRRKVWNKLAWAVLLGCPCVRLRKRISIEAEVTRPDFRCVVNL